MAGENLEIARRALEELRSGEFLTTQRSVGHFRASEIPFDGLWATILWIRDGKVVRAQGFLNKRRAMRAAGAAQ
jgi:hypothetical protein